MIDALFRDLKPLLLCFVLAVLVWFLVGEHAGSSNPQPLLDPASQLTPPLQSP